MPRFMVVARDPRIDLYQEDDFYGAEVVEAEDEVEAISASAYDQTDQSFGLHVHAFRVQDDAEVGECDLSDYEPYEEA